MLPWPPPPDCRSIGLLGALPLLSRLGLLLLRGALRAVGLRGLGLSARRVARLVATAAPAWLVSVARRVAALLRGLGLLRGVLRLLRRPGLLGGVLRLLRRPGLLRCVLRLLRGPGLLGGVLRLLRRLGLLLLLLWLLLLLVLSLGERGSNGAGQQEQNGCCENFDDFHERCLDCNSLDVVQAEVRTG